MDTGEPLSPVMTPPNRRQELFVVGLGNVGSQVLPLIPSLPEIERVTLVDFDHYESANLDHQRIAPGAIGQPKARVQARVLRALAPRLQLTAQVCPIEALPMIPLRHAIVLSCVDSRAARQYINERALALGFPWIDAGLSRDGNVRARAHVPGLGPCLECAWSARDYELIEQRLPCEGQTSSAAATRAAPELGALVAGLQIALARRLLREDSDAPSVACQQWHYHLPSGRGWAATYDINPQCRADHAPWQITPLGQGSVTMALSDALALAGGPSADAALSLAGMWFARRLRCLQCRRVRRLRWRLSGRLKQTVCDSCGSALHMSALDAVETLHARNSTAALRRTPLARLGFLPGDVFTITTARATRHYELA